MRRSDFFLILILVILVLILVVWVALRPQPSPQPTLQQVAAAPTNTPSLQSRLTAAQTNVEALQGQLALPTAIPEMIDFSTWETIIGDGVSIALPASYEGGEASEEFINRMLEIAPEVATAARSYIEQNPDIVRLMAMDPTGASLPSMNILRVSAEGAGSIEQVADAIVNAMPAGITVRRRDIIGFQNTTASRLDIENTMVPEFAVRQLQYTFISGNAAWTLTYGAPIDEFPRLLPIFEISARSFAIIG